MTDLDRFKAAADALAEALQLADAALSGANMNLRIMERKVRTALTEYCAARADIETPQAKDQPHD